MAERKSLDELFIEGEYDLSNPFEAKCWEVVKLIYNEMPPPEAVPHRLIMAAIDVRTKYEIFRLDPTPAHLDAVKHVLDVFLPAFEESYGSKWSEAKKP